MTNRMLAGLCLAAIAAPARDSRWPPPRMRSRASRQGEPATRAEAESRVVERFAELDADKHGVVTRAETRQGRDMLARIATRGAGGLGQYFDTMDKDHDGSVSRAEFDSFRAGGGASHPSSR